MVEKVGRAEARAKRTENARGRRSAEGASRSRCSIGGNVKDAIAGIGREFSAAEAR